jgi:hypothetical protein|tara:strand:- start:17725 stop:20334 length:2610 start_codon:yes stop_codon:yes gene_type:complete
MSIIQISKIQQRAGNLVDLPQLDEAEIGFASDAKRVFIGKTTSGLENIEVLTSYSDITFSQIDGAVGNLNISNSSVADGQVLAYDGTNWVNRGGDAGGLVDLGEISNVAIDGGSIGYTIETDGLGNLSWTPKGTITAYIEDVSQANPGVVTSTAENFLTSGQEVTITGAVGMTQLNGGTYYANVLTANTFSLYSDTALTTPVDTSAFTDYSFTSATATTTATNQITVGDSSVFALNIPVRFTGLMSTSELNIGNTYYINSKPSGTTITVSDSVFANGVAGNIKALNTATLTSANVYGVGGRAVASVGGGSGGSAAQGSNTSVQYNNSGVIDGDGDFVWDFSAGKTLTVNGNANVGNLNGTGSVTASRLISNVATGTTPIVVDSTTRVANLSVAYANVSDFGVVGNLTTGNYFPALVGTSGTGNKALNVSGSYTFDTANAKFVSGNVEATYDVAASTFTGTLATAAQPNVTSLGTLTSLEVAGSITPDANVTYDLGNNTNRFRDLYLSGSSIALGFQDITSNATHTTFTNKVAADQFIGNVVGILQGDAGNVSNVQGANVAGEVNFAATANAVAGANVSGTVALASVASTVSGAAQANITSVGTLSSLTVSANVGAGNVNATGGVFTYVSGDGANLTALTGANVTGEVTNAATANAVAGANVSGTVSSATSATSATTAGTVTTAAQPNITSTGTLTSLTVSGALDVLAGTLTADTLTTGANTTAGSITGNWTLTAGSKLESTYADLAEYYNGEEDYESGTVVCFGGSKEIHVSDVKCSNRVAGIVSTNPAYIMNQSQTGIPVAVALQGRVPCKVTGKCEKGDIMVHDGQGGATAWYNVATIMKPGVVIGKAIAEKTNSELSIIEIAVGRL